MERVYRYFKNINAISFKIKKKLSQKFERAGLIIDFLLLKIQYNCIGRIFWTKISVKNYFLITN